RVFGGFEERDEGHVVVRGAWRANAAGGEQTRSAEPEQRRDHQMARPAVEHGRLTGRIRGRSRAEVPGSCFHPACPRSSPTAAPGRLSELSSSFRWPAFPGKEWV